VGWKGSELDELSRHRMIRRLIGLEVSDLVHTSDLLIKEARLSSPEDAQRLPYNVVTFSEEMVRRNRPLKDFLFKNLYRHHRVVRMQTKAERIISELFSAYRNEPQMLPRHIQETIEERGLERTICDYIAGMTDRFAVEEYNKLFEPLTKP